MKTGRRLAASKASLCPEGMMCLCYISPCLCETMTSKDWLTIQCAWCLRLALRSGLAEGEFSIPIILRLVTNQSQNSAHDISHHHLAGLRCH